MATPAAPAAPAAGPASSSSSSSSSTNEAAAHHNPSVLSPESTAYAASLADTFACGCSAGFISELILYPLEHPSLASNNASAGRMLVARDLLNVCVTRAPATGLLMACYEFARTSIAARYPDANTFSISFFSGILATAVESIFLAPFISISDKLHQLRAAAAAEAAAEAAAATSFPSNSSASPSSSPSPSPSPSPSSKPPAVAKRNITYAQAARAVGLGRLYQGPAIASLILTTAPFVSFYYMFSDMAIAWIRARRPPESDRPAWVDSAVGGAVGGTAAIVVSAPVEMLRNMYAARSASAAAAESAADKTPDGRPRDAATTAAAAAAGDALKWKLVHQPPRFAFRRAFFGIVRSSTRSLSRPAVRGVLSWGSLSGRGVARSAAKAVAALVRRVFVK
ncbi:hypothetical protein DFJ73DRAFT_961772 [Zopfochytrium polystomum]|nr:hypothetical protein DFJ73DRAFT_961772 [Zopfochytrium polystomum]